MLLNPLKKYHSMITSIKVTPKSHQNESTHRESNTPCAIQTFQSPLHSPYTTTSIPPRGTPVTNAHKHSTHIGPRPDKHRKIEYTPDIVRLRARKSEIWNSNAAWPVWRARSCTSSRWAIALVSRESGIHVVCVHVCILQRERLFAFQCCATSCLWPSLQQRFNVEICSFDCFGNTESGVLLILMLTIIWECERIVDDGWWKQ